MNIFLLKSGPLIMKEMVIMTEPVIISILGTLLASGGFWALVTKLLDRKSAKTKMILGLGHDRIMDLGMRYIERGSITQSEYENLYKYLYEPYKKMGGNGSAERLMKEVDKLKIIPDKY